MQVPAPFEYARASSVEEAIELLGRLGPGARLLAGGHSLLPMMKLRLAAPEVLIDIDPLAGELGYITERDGAVAIGAMTRHQALLESELLATRLQIFTDAERVIADPVVRRRGTIGGALCQADPSEDLSAVCAAVGAELVIQGPAGERVLDMEAFHRGPYVTAVGPDEILTEIRVPLVGGAGSAYEKVDRRAGDWAIAAAGAWLVIGEGGRITRARVALAAVGSALTSGAAAQALIGQPPSDELFSHVGELTGAACRPVCDQRGSVRYKRHLAGVLTARTLRRAAARAAGAPCG